MNAELILKLVEHLGTLVTTGRDAEKLVSDLMTGKAVGPDAQALISDVSAILAVFPIPGVDPGIITSALASLKAAV